MNDIVFLNNDASKLDLEDESVDLIVTAPPYFGVNTDRYGGIQNKQINHISKSSLFVEKLIIATKEMSRVLKNTGVIIINIGNNDNSAFKYAVKVEEDTDLKLNHTIVWDYSESMDMRAFDLENQVPETYGFWFILNKKNQKLFMHPFEAKKQNLSIFTLPCNNKEHDKFLENLNIGYFGDTFPQELIDTFIRVFSRPNQIVLDPFGGSGLVAVRALMQNRKGITNDISDTQLQLAKARYEHYLSNKNSMT